MWMHLLSNRLRDWDTLVNKKGPFAFSAQSTDKKSGGLNRHETPATESPSGFLHGLSTRRTVVVWLVSPYPALSGYAPAGLHVPETSLHFLYTRCFCQIQGGCLGRQGSARPKAGFLGPKPHNAPLNFGRWGLRSLGTIGCDFRIHLF